MTTSQPSSSPQPDHRSAWIGAGAAVLVAIIGATGAYFAANRSPSPVKEPLTSPAAPLSPQPTPAEVAVKDKQPESHAPQPTDLKVVPKQPETAHTDREESTPPKTPAQHTTSPAAPPPLQRAVNDGMIMDLLRIERQGTTLLVSFELSNPIHERKHLPALLQRSGAQSPGVTYEATSILMGPQNLTTIDLYKNERITGEMRLSNVPASVKSLTALGVVFGTPGMGAHEFVWKDVQLP